MVKRKVLQHQLSQASDWERGEQVAATVVGQTEQALCECMKLVNLEMKACRDLADQAQEDTAAWVEKTAVVDLEASPCQKMEYLVQLADIVAKMTE